jgi:uncharacterized tellurite resistance protein B-like protein
MPGCSHSTLIAGHGGVRCVPGEHRAQGQRSLPGVTQSHKALAERGTTPRKGETMSEENGETLTPALAFAVALTHMAAADGTFQPEEDSKLTAIFLHRNIGGMSYEELMHHAVVYYQSTSLDDFLSEAAQLLTTSQQFCILLNLIDTAMADGAEADEEQALLQRFLQAFGISEAEMAPYRRAIIVKNNLSIFPT